jgi:hypothetical protein
VKIKAGESKNVSFVYSDSSTDAKIAGTGAIAPVQVTDFSANTEEGGGGDDKTTKVTAAISEEFATKTIVAFTSTALVDVWIEAGAKIRGTKITDFGESEYIVQDDTSIEDNNLHDFTYPYPVDTLSEATFIGDYLLSLGKDPIGHITKVTIFPQKSVALTQAALQRKIGDRITLSEDQLVVSSKDYFIIGEDHSLDRKGKHTLSWILEPADNQLYWILGIVGFSEVGDYTTTGPY